MRRPVPRAGARAPKPERRGVAPVRWIPEAERWPRHQRLGLPRPSVFHIPTGIVFAVFHKMR